ncbi:MAG: UbiD family decarboxylase domain-containing protein, partial [Syntrophothermus sp.]
MVKCLTNDLEVPSDVDFVIEGYIDPSEELVLEGPFGDHTGFYSLADFYPRFHVTCITHRKDAVYPATIVGIPPMEDGWIGKATERIFLNPIKTTAVPELLDMVMPGEGVFHNIAIAKIKSTYPGHALKVMNALWGAGQMMFNKILIVTGEEVDIHDYRQVMDAVLQRVDLATDLHFSTGPLDVLDHSGRKFAFGSKMGIDATGDILPEIPDPLVLKNDLLQRFPEIRSVNDEFIQRCRGVLILSIEKTEKDQVKKIANQLLEQGLIRNVSWLVVTDSPLDLSVLNLVTWIAAGNIDPQRDCYLNGKTLVLDATRKSSVLDDFSRDWPNVLVMDDDTIHLVDQKWNTLGLGSFIASPSLALRGMALHNKAIF